MNQTIRAQPYNIINSLYDHHCFRRFDGLSSASKLLHQFRIVLRHVTTISDRVSETVGRQNPQELDTDGGEFCRHELHCHAGNKKNFRGAGKMCERRKKVLNECESDGI